MWEAWRRAWQPTPVFLPGESPAQRSLAGYSPWSYRVRHNWSTLLARVHASPRDISETLEEFLQMTLCVYVYVCVFRYCDTVHFCLLGVRQITEKKGFKNMMQVYCHLLVAHSLKMRRYIKKTITKTTWNLPSCSEDNSLLVLTSQLQISSHTSV